MCLHNNLEWVNFDYSNILINKDTKNDSNYRTSNT